MKFKIGTDPELFVRNKETGEYRSGHTLIPGNKQDPYVVKGGAVQVDGVALEFNTNPAETSSEFLSFITMVRSAMTRMALNEMGPGWDVVATPTAVFTKEYFDELPEEPKRLGCTPDYNAYTGKPNHPPHTDEPFRTGAGHIHVGWGQYFDPHDEEHFETCRNVVKQLDAVLFPLSYMWDQDEKRRELYGKKGSFRPKSYGVEYRPLSNAYLNSPKVITQVFDVTMGAVDLYFNKGIKLYEL